MADIYLKSSTGIPYAFRISGDTPTPQEQYRIDQFLRSQEKQPVAAPVAQEEEEATGFFSGLGAGLESGGHSTIGGLASLGEDIAERVAGEDSDVAQYFGGVSDYRRQKAAEVNMPEEGLAWLGSQVGSTLPMTVGSLAGGALGLLAAGPVGAAVGAGTVGSAFGIGQTMERQKQEYGDVTDPARAYGFGAAIGAVEVVADRLLPGVGRMLTKPVTDPFVRNLAKSIAEKGVLHFGASVGRRAGQGAVVEGATEYGQQLLERLGAGLDISSPEAQQEALQAAIAGAAVGSVLGPALGTTADVVERNRTMGQRRGDYQAYQDELRRQQDATRQLGFAEERRKDRDLRLDEFYEQQAKNRPKPPLTAHNILPTLAEEAIRTKKPVTKERIKEAIAAMQVGTPDQRAAAEQYLASQRARFPNEMPPLDAKNVGKAPRKLTDAQKRAWGYDAALEYSKGVDNVTIDGLKKSLRIGTEKATALRNQLVQDEFIVPTQDGKYVPSTKYGRKGTLLEPRSPFTTELAVQRADSKTGGDAYAVVEQRRVNGDIVSVKALSTFKTEKEAHDALRAMEDGPGAEAKRIATEARLREERTLEYQARVQDTGKFLRGILNKYGLTDVGLRLASQIEPESGSLIEGVTYQTDPKTGALRHLVALATDIYDPRMTDSETNEALASVLHHEILHAVRNLGLLTDLEWQMLVDLVIKHKKPGKNYTYAQASIARHGDNEAMTNEAILEEAIAEILRDSADGKLSQAPQTKGIISKIIRFLKDLAKKFKGTPKGLEVLEKIKSGEVGSRPRQSGGASAEAKRSEIYDFEQERAKRRPTPPTEDTPLEDDPDAYESEDLDDEDFVDEDLDAPMQDIDYVPKMGENPVRLKDGAWHVYDFTRGRYLKRRFNTRQQAVEFMERMEAVWGKASELGLEVIDHTLSTKYSSIKAPKDAMIPIKYAGTEIFGYVQESDLRIPVYFPLGGEWLDNEGKWRGFGFRHAMKHADEIRENSNFKSLVEAIYRTVQQYTNGENNAKAQTGSFGQVRHDHDRNRFAIVAPHKNNTEMVVTLYRERTPNGPVYIVFTGYLKDKKPITYKGKKYSKIEPAPLFYSEATSAIENVPMKRGRPDQWLSRLKDAGMSNDEAEYTEIRDWLNEQGPKAEITKDQLVDFLQAHRISIAEHIYDDDPKDREFSGDYDRIVNYSTWVSPGGKDYRELLLILEPPAWLKRELEAAKQLILEKRLKKLEDYTISYFQDEKDNSWGAWGLRTNNPNHVANEWAAINRATGDELYLQGERTLREVQKEFRQMLEFQNSHEKEHLERSSPVSLLDSAAEYDPRFRDVLQKASEKLDSQFTRSHGSHWSKPNVLAHVRFKTRTDDQGNKVLFIEEIQSDWHQQGRQYSYEGELQKIPAERIRMLRSDLRDFLAEEDYLGFEDAHEAIHAIEEHRDDFAERWEMSPELKAAAQAYVDARRHNERFRGAVPKAPLKDTWSALALKRMIRWAAENEFDKITWTTGKTQFERYDRPHLDERVRKRLRGLIPFYDKILSDVANKMLKRFGVKVERTSVVTGEGTGSRLQTGQTYTIDRLANAVAALREAPYESNAISPFTEQSTHFSTISLARIIEDVHDRALIEAADRFGDPDAPDNTDTQRDEHNIVVDTIENTMGLGIDEMETIFGGQFSDAPIKETIPAHGFQVTEDMKQAARNRPLPLYGTKFSRIDFKDINQPIDPDVRVRLKREYEWGVREYDIFKGNVNVGYVAITPPSTEDDYIHIEMISGRFGPKSVREVARQLFVEFPEAQTIEGSRISGARSENDDKWGESVSAHRDQIVHKLTPKFSRIEPPSNPDLERIEKATLYNNLAPVLGKVAGWTRMVEPETGQRKAEDFLIMMQDRMLSVGALVDKIKQNGGTVHNQNDTYFRQVLFPGRTDERIVENRKTLYNRALQAIKSMPFTDADKARGVKINEAAALILNNYKNANQGFIELFLYANHAIERNREMRLRNEKLKEKRPREYESGSGMTDEEAAQILGWLNSDKRVNRLREASRFVYDIIENTNRVRSEGKLSPDFRNDPEYMEFNRYSNYVPLRSWVEEQLTDDDQLEEFAKAGRGFSIRGKEDFSAIGRQRMAAHIVEHVMLQNMEAIVRAEKNAVGESFLTFLEENPEQTKAVAEILYQHPMRFALSENGSVRQVPDLQYKGRPDVLVVKRGTQEVAIRIKDARIARALVHRSGLGNPGFDMLIKGLAWVNRRLAAVRTSYNPDFLVSNAFRDLIAANINLSELEVAELRRAVITNLPKAYGGIRETLRHGTEVGEWAQAYRDFRKHGGQTAFYGIRELSDTINTVNKEISQDLSGPLTSSKKAMKEIGKFVADYNLLIENGTRLAVYKAVLDKLGNTPRAKERAAFIAKNATVNFNAGGESKAVANAFYLFYNASLQGTFALLNPLIRSKKIRRVWMTVALMGMMQDLVMSLFSPDDENGKRYDNIPDYVLESNMVFLDPLGMTERGYFKIPLPYGMSAIFNTGRSAMKFVRGGQSAGDTVNSIFGELFDSFNPLGAPYTWANWVSPTVLDPFFDLGQNIGYDEKPIYKDDRYGTDLPASQRYWNNTNPTYVTVADWMHKLTGGGIYQPGLVELSPDVIDYMIQFTTGGIGGTLSRVTKIGGSALTGDFDEIRLADVPIVRRAVGEITDRHDLSAFIERRDELDLIRKEAKGLQEAGRFEEYRQFVNRYRNEIRNSVQMNKIDNLRKKLSKRITEIKKSDRYSAAQRDQLIDRLQKQINELIGRGIQLSSDSP